jgi:hypothetical protein
MSEYTDALAELVALQGRLDRQLERSAKQIAAERSRSEREIESRMEEHEAVLARLESTLDRARSERVRVAADAGQGPARVSSDPLDQASQMVTRLEGALEQVLYTRKSLVAEEAALSEEEKRRAAEERRQREREGRRRDEAWERARQGSNFLLAGLAVFAVAGLIAGLVGFAATLAICLLAGVFGAVLSASTESTLPALAVRRACGKTPELPAAAPRESRLAGAAYAAASVGLAGLAALVAAIATGGDSTTLLLGATVALAGSAVTVCIWLLVPRTGRL